MMSMNDQMNHAEENILHTYNRFPVVFDHGDGCYLYDTEGKKYLDFAAGIAVNALGYHYPGYDEALKAQIDKLTHISNLYYNEPMSEAGEKLIKASGLCKAFFTNDEVYSLCDRDILELINYKFSLKYCPICNELFVKRDKRVNFCPKCSADKKAQKKYNDRKRKRNTIQIEHKAIVDMLRNRGEDYNDFVTESYYYRDLIEGQEVSSCPNGYDSSIQTKKQYEEWLKQKHKELTKRPKNRLAH